MTEPMSIDEASSVLPTLYGPKEGAAVTRAIVLSIAWVLLWSGPAWAQREGLGMGEGFVAKVVGTVQEHPVETVGGSAATAAALVALIRALNKRKKEDSDRG